MKSPLRKLAYIVWYETQFIKTCIYIVWYDSIHKKTFWEDISLSQAVDKRVVYIGLSSNIHLSTHINMILSGVAKSGKTRKMPNTQSVQLFPCSNITNIDLKYSVKYLSEIKEMLIIAVWLQLSHVNPVLTKFYVICYRIVTIKYLSEIFISYT